MLPLAFRICLSVPLGDDLAAAHAGAGPHVDDIVGGADRVLVMLDDEHGVAEIAEAAQRREQHVVVALVKADAGFVEDVEHARQAAADLAGEADALRFAARERAAGAIEVEVIEPDIVEEAEALDDLLQDAFGDRALLVAEMLGEVGEELQRVDDREVRRVGDVLHADLDAQCLGLEARAVADLAGLRGLVFAELLAHPRALGLEEAAVEVADDALERLSDIVFLAPVDEGQRDGLALRSVEDGLRREVGQVLPRGVEVEREFAREGAEHLHVIGAGRVRFRPGDDRALLDAEVVVGDDEVFIEDQLLAEPVARGACALGGVEAEQARFDLADREAADGTGEFLAEDDAAGGGVVAEDFGFGGVRLDRIGGVDIGEAIGQLQRGLETLGEARADITRRTTRRSTTTSMSCLYFLSSAGASSISYISPSMRTLVKPAFCHSAISLRYSPLRPRTTGASR